MRDLQVGKLAVGLTSVMPSQVWGIRAQTHEQNTNKETPKNNMITLAQTSSALIITTFLSFPPLVEVVVVVDKEEHRGYVNLTETRDRGGCTTRFTTPHEPPWQNTGEAFGTGGGTSDDDDNDDDENKPWDYFCYCYESEQTAPIHPIHLTLSRTDDVDRVSRSSTSTSPVVWATPDNGSLSAAQQIVQDEMLTRFPSRLSDSFWGSTTQRVHDDYDDDNNNNNLIWTGTRGDDIMDLSAASYRNHVVVIQLPPPFQASFLRLDDDGELSSMDRLAEDIEQQIRRQQVRKQRRHARRYNNTKFQCVPLSALSQGELPSTNPQDSVLSNEQEASASSILPTTAVTPTTTITSEVSSSREASSLEPDEKYPKPGKEESVLVDYASKSAGALIIEKSTGWKGTSNLLTSDNDQYAIVPTAESNKALIIGLSEEILVKKVVLSNYERYSSNVKEFQILGSQTMAHWANLGFYTAKSDKFGRQEFELQESENWARYLRFRIISHYGDDEHYLTITQISVHGTTMQQGFQEQWEENQQDSEQQSNDAALDRELQKGEKSSSSSSLLDRNVTDSIPFHNVTLTNSSSNDAGSTVSLNNLLPTRLITSEANDSVTSHAFVDDKICSSCRVRGVGSNGYLLFDWILPPLIESKCQWTALSSASVASKSTAHRHLLKLPSPSTDELVTLPRKAPFPLHSSCVPPVMKHKNLICGGKASRSLPRIVLEESAAVASLLALVKKETDELLDLVEFKIKYIPSIRLSSMGGSAEVVISSQSPVLPEHTSQTDHGGDKVAPCAENASNSADGESEAPRQLSYQDSLREAAAVGDDFSTMDLLLARVPSASCLLELNLTQYKIKAMQSRSSTAGTTHSNPSTSGMEPVFKKLTGEIKSLQATLAMHERLATDSMYCFQRVLLDLLVQQEQEREIQNRRLDQLENFLSGTYFYHSFLDVMSALGNMLSPVYLYHVVERLVLWIPEMIPLSWYNNNSRLVGGTTTITKWLVENPPWWWGLSFSSSSSNSGGCDAGVGFYPSLWFLMCRWLGTCIVENPWWSLLSSSVGFPLWILCLCIIVGRRRQYPKNRRKCTY